MRAHLTGLLSLTDLPCSATVSQAHIMLPQPPPGMLLFSGSSRIYSRDARSSRTCMHVHTLLRLPATLNPCPGQLCLQDGAKMTDRRGDKPHALLELPAPSLWPVQASPLPLIPSS